MLEGTLRVFLACFSPSRSCTCMYRKGCAFRLQPFLLAWCSPGATLPNGKPWHGPEAVIDEMVKGRAQGGSRGWVSQTGHSVFALQLLLLARERCGEGGGRKRKQKDRICHLEKCYFVAQPALLVMVGCLLNISTRVIYVAAHIVAKFVQQDSNN